MEPDVDGLIATPNDVKLSWEPVPGNNPYYNVYIREKGESEYQSKAGGSDTECYIRNYNDYFKYEHSYEWYVQTWNPCGGEIRSETRTFTIGSAADLVITDIKVEPAVAVSGKEFTITATITNNGTKNIESTTWTDKITCSSDYSLTRSYDQRSQSLQIGDSYKVSFTLSAPYEEESTSLIFELTVDTNNALQELSKSNNKQTFEVLLALLSIPEEEYQVLCDLYNQAGGENWTLNRKWDTSTNAVDKYGWEGVTLDDDGHVTEIDLSNKGLVGTIPTGLFSLPYLTVLNLSHNQLNGDLKEAIPEGSNAPIESINLSYNQLSGTVPASINQLPKLTRLELNRNQLEAIEEALLGIDLYLDSQEWPEQEIPLVFDLELDIPSIACYNHGNPDEWPDFTLSIPGTQTPMNLVYDSDKNVYHFEWDIYYHHVNLPPEQDLTLTQSTGSMMSTRGSQATVRFTFPQGDANMDAAVDIKDVQHTLNFITKDGSSGQSGYIDFNYYAANTYQDEEVEETINVQDLVVTINIVLDTPQTFSTSLLRSSESTGPVAYLSIEEGKLVIDNPVEPVTALDITLKGVTSKQIELLLPSNDYLYTTRDLDGGVRFILLCMSGEGIPLGKTDIMKVNGSNATIAHAHLANKEAHEVLSDFEGKETATGNESFKLDEPSANQIRIDEDVEAVIVSVYDMGGHILSYHRIQEVVPGNYNIRQWLSQELPTGIYLVHFELHKASEIKHQTIKVSLTK